MAKERLDKVLSHLGVGSRSEVRRMARAGRVRVDGQVVRDPSCKLDPERVRIEVDEAPLVYRRYFHLLLNKPAGCITSTREREGVPVTALLPPPWQRPDWMPVGRLDKDAEGLLLLTTHGELAHRLTHPRWKVSKRYYVELEAPATLEDVQAFASGRLLLDGKPLKPAELRLGPDPRRVELVLLEGRFHQVKRMFAARGNRVLYLRRISFGPLELPADLSPGMARALEPQELEALYRTVGLSCTG
ncbi:MAG: rRNA pseudouridine synthase [Meiothermus sp.]|uniref:pseudouridine synthase n=1 Tax=Meiothermus sp. TaxID=1955249 RepID=UPI0025D10677|nr:pseudouridine synthase [Meiothermus sp.]MCS7058679.1 rRNA pseudouridine synthase [Meiothermus sp.]MCS7195271.1 rRNA pseudouridine synthase [Meiothermus sp.]MCX7741529.1 rRNA pseudouridine synthase [Meiothermus sp.]MDW8089994.1 pseudouridine synthase [Meiothermus sp.]MDW8480644.1 pseudouridine synthase [Meiothermus sp.]